MKIMQVEYAFLCKKAEYESPNSVESINAEGISSNCCVNVPHLPVTPSMTLVVCWTPHERGAPEDTGDGYLYVEFWDPNLKKIPWTCRVKPITQDNPAQPHEFINKGLLIMPIDNLPIEMYGTHTIRLVYGRETKWTVSLTIQEERKGK